MPSQTTTATTLAAALLESDRRYFELGAHVELLDGATLAWMPGMQEAPGGCVVQRVRTGDIGPDPHRWVAGVMRRLAALGCSVARIYLEAPAPPLEAALRQAGFERRVEVGYVAEAELPDGREAVTLRPVVSDGDWETKHRLHRDSVVGSDGHLLSGRSWVALERRKCEEGMRAHLIEDQGAVVGAVSSMEVNGLQRAKNVFVHPEHRRRGIGAGAMRRISQAALAGGCGATGIFGVEGKAGNALYRRLGMAPVVEQYEWARRL